MLADRSNRKQPTVGELYRDAPDTGPSYPQNLTSTVKAFRAGHVQAGQMPNLNVLPIR